MTVDPVNPGPLIEAELEEAKDRAEEKEAHFEEVV